MKRNTKVLLAVLLSVFMLTVVACGSNDDTSSESGAGASTESNESNESNDAVRKVTIFEDAKRSEEENLKKMYEDFTNETGIEVEMVVIPGDGIEIFKKIDVQLVTGDQTDVIRLSNPLLIQKYMNNGWLAPLDDVMAEDGYDAESIFGEFLREGDDGKTYVLPYQAGKWAVYYNKKIFDEAGVPYPSGYWTWDEYIETAKQLTDKNNGIYGSYMLDYDAYLYMLARQYEVEGYKEDGTSNYDDPKFAEALQFFGDLGNVHEIQPSWLEFKSSKLSWDGFMSGNYGMHFIGSWYSSLFADQATYPRDWEVGITQIPVPADGNGDNNFGVDSGYGINKSAANPDEAYEFIKWMAENQYKYAGDLPARVDLTEDQIAELFQDYSDSVNGEITAEDMNNALFTSDLGFVDEKIVGPAATEYGNIILQEGELYLVGQTSLEDTVQTIKQRADKAIEDAETDS
ncbi:sugar ABC transporter substrate-binding protein [Halolactibacillus alkaliphilus]|uniref:Sugar ABC transporter substrate-binding protein n=1 Tax=Halolactibacillus alkaliphilus TaxID=442899 RepID=A0A511X0J9_9BACI|nr:sugar ABC transporter substrate-binding protein [Halolactibacillus alkaliphilus]GEN56465.1 sugar ABC transporter substrate-binding protein [Halolactibacillus alkaliphilus]GGN64315.1 sugar ABC transporter substrate-binding protein [Halolactibacillus alkaliphilus]SFO61380.1 multiple sugar transport system substrate-binding protein [Halolactibacillus alkaliphilus]